jgi:hypothetical protein
VPNELTQSVAACGTTTDVLDKIAEWADHGCTEPVITPLGDDPFDTLNSIAKKANLPKTGAG